MKVYFLNHLHSGIKRIIFTIFTLLLSFGTFASDDHHDEDKAPFDAAEMIMDHIGDAHDIHFIGHTHWPLPIILYHPEKGFSMFMSSKFNHGHDAYNGYRWLSRDYIAENGLDPNVFKHDKIVVVGSNGLPDAELTAKLWDFSITKNVVTVLISVIVLIWMMTAVAKSYRRREGQAPKGLQSFIEPIIIFVRDDIAKASIGEKKYAKFMPYLLTLFFFIWINNIFGLIPIAPFGTNTMGNIAAPIVMAVFTFLIVNFNGNKHYWGHIFAMPGVPIPILPLVILIEILGVFLKPLVLIIRLFANITAGHIVMLVFFSLIFIFGEQSAGAGYGVSVASVAFTIFLNFLELLVGALQAYVFTLLSAIYIGMAVQEAHH